MVSTVSPQSYFLLRWALNDSMKPFCQGFPGSMKAVSTPAELHHPISAAVVMRVSAHTP
jgi:hypothetical protein